MKKPTAQQIIIPMLLGDAYAGGRCGHTKHMEFCHSVKQVDYAIWKMNLLKRYVQHKTRTFRRIHKPPQIGVYVPAHHRITAAYKKMYRDGKKCVTEKALKKITPLGLAIWFMDDGNVLWRRKTRHGNPSPTPRILSIQLNTHGFSLEENALIAKWFEQQYGFRFRVMQDKRCNKWFLRLGIKEQVEAFIEIIKPYVLQIPAMHYKVGLADTELIGSEL